VERAIDNLNIQLKKVVTIAGKLSDDVHPKTEQSILKQAGIK
jgi:predicted RNA binding protein YcfA (HicA-like mRNA interferase family)